MLKPKNKPKAPSISYSPVAMMVPGMPFNGVLHSYEINVGDNVKVIEDKKSKTKVANFPFEFPDGTRGIAIICRVKDEPWQPSKTISHITLNFR